MVSIEDKSEEDLILESNILKLRLLKIEEELNKRKEQKKDTGLRDKKGEKILIGSKVKLLTPSTTNSPFAGKTYARVVGTGHNGKRVKLGLLDDRTITTDRTPKNVENVQEK